MECNVTLCSSLRYLFGVQTGSEVGVECLKASGRLLWRLCEKLGSNLILWEAPCAEGPGTLWQNESQLSLSVMDQGLRRQACWSIPQLRFGSLRIYPSGISVYIPRTNENWESSFFPHLSASNDKSVSLGLSYQTSLVLLHLLLSLPPLSKLKRSVLSWSDVKGLSVWCPGDWAEQ